MEYRQIGNTGVMASILGMGGEHLDGKPYPQVEATARAALDAGVNHLDVFMPGQEVRRNIAKALGDRRKDVTIQGHIGSTDVGQQYDISRDMPTVRKYFEDLLRIFGYIDFGMLFFIDSQKDYQGVFETPFIDYALKLKETGDIRHIGFSSHNPVMARQVIQTGLVEMMMFSINLAFDLYPAQVNALDQLNQGLSNEAFSGLDPQRAALYQLCLLYTSIRPHRSDRHRKVAPPNRVAGNSLAWLGPVIMRRMWGTTSPTKPMVPPMDTLTPMSTETAPSTASLTPRTFTPRCRA